MIRTSRQYSVEGTGFSQKPPQSSSSKSTGGSGLRDSSAVGEWMAVKAENHMSSTACLLFPTVFTKSLQIQTQLSVFVRQALYPNFKACCLCFSVCPSPLLGFLSSTLGLHNPVHVTPSLLSRLRFFLLSVGGLIKSCASCLHTTMLTLL